MGRDDDLFGGVGAMLEMFGSLQPAGVPCVHLEAAIVDRHELVHFVELVDLGAKLLGQVEVVGGQLVLRIVAAADAAIPARDAAGTPWSDPAEVRIVDLDAWAAK